MTAELNSFARNTELFGDIAIDMSRAWAMPHAQTFCIPPIAEFLDRWLSGRRSIIDPFCGESKRATFANDLAHGGVDAEAACQQWKSAGVVADAVLFDPPYSPRQISEVYK